jgi:dTDP-4-amino-4,6-dideoxygalactose transaminase
VTASAAETSRSTLHRKTIRTREDLAINGAPSAFSEPMLVGQPNIGDRARFFSLLNGMLDRNWLSNNGPLVQQLERRIEAQLGVRNCVCVCNATNGLSMAARALGLTGEVVVPSYSFIATAHALEWVGLKPVFADIDPVTHNIDPDAVRRAITPRTSAILAVHLWSRPADVEALKAMADEHRLKLFFDAAHAFGVSHGGRMIGNFGACEVFSFHATKFFNAIEGGAVVTNDDELAGRLRLMCNFGFAGSDNVVSVGTNAKMNEASAAMALANFDHLETLVTVNRANHRLYSERLGRIPGLSVLPFDTNEHHNCQYVVLEVGPDYPASRDELLAALHAENVMARKYFWPGIHRMMHYADTPANTGIALRNTELVADRVIVLPTGFAVGVAEIGAITDVAAVLAG